MRSPASRACFGSCLLGRRLRSLFLGSAFSACRQPSLLRPSSRGALLDDFAAAGQRGVREDDVVAAQHVVGVELAALDQLHFGQVEEALDGVGVVDVDHDQRLAFDAESAEQLLGVLGLRRVETPRIDDDDLAVGRPVAERRAQRELDHLLRGLLVVLARLRAVGDATAAHVRRAAGALAGVTGALLLERLPATAANLGSRLGALRTTAASGQLSGDDLVHQRHVGLHAEHRLVEVEVAGIVAGRVLHCDRCHVGHLPFTALRTMTTPPFGPGTEPLTSSRLRSMSACTTSRLSVVTCSWPMWPAIFRPLNTRPG